LQGIQWLPVSNAHLLAGAAALAVAAKMPAVSTILHTTIGSLICDTIA
jgi:hypothetical protein